MPGRDGRGPLGQGPMTGRGLGNCNPGYSGLGGYGRGRGFFGRGFRKFGNWFGFGVNNAPVLSAQEESTLLKEDARAIEEELKRIQQRLSELEKESKK